jgi:hypothetical protein
MPDEYGFDWLGETRRCIDCGEGGPVWEWGERERARHFARHERAREFAARERRRTTKREAARRLREITRLRKETRR